MDFHGITDKESCPCSVVVGCWYIHAVRRISPFIVGQALQLRGVLRGCLGDWQRLCLKPKTLGSCLFCRTYGVKQHTPPILEGCGQTLALERSGSAFSLACIPPSIFLSFLLSFLSSGQTHVYIVLRQLSGM